MKVWVLVFGVIGSDNAFVIPGIESEPECKVLAQKIVAAAPAGLKPSWNCLPYQGNK